jgi:bifunctional DNA-binding transcriptional regulator/antitoxin component of YhaV-PrlF toxin-antitoxin module
MKEIVSAVTSKGQATIPVEVRRHLGVGTPDRVAFAIEDGTVRLAPARVTLKSLYGSVNPLPGRETIDFEDQIEEVMDEEADRFVRSLGGR